MITFENRFFPARSVACFFIDGGVILVSVVTSFLILHRAGFVSVLKMEDALIRGISITFFCQSCMYFLDLYDLKISHSWEELFFSVIFATGFFCIGIGVISYAFPVMGMAMEMYYLTILLMVILLMAWRSAFYLYINRVAPFYNILIIGAGKLAQIVAEEINARSRMGFRLAGIVSTLPQDDDPPSADSQGISSGYRQVEDLVKKNRVHKVVVAAENRRGHYPIREMLALRAKGYTVVEWQSFFEKLTGRIPVDNLAPSYFIFNEGFRKSYLILLPRRVISFLTALAGLIVFAPFFAVIPLIIRLDSPGRIFYLQTRVGLNGKTFKLIKFRSMVEDSEGDRGPQWASANDPRITRVGKWIRKYRIDEIPQLINVLRGDLDLVGPRPERPLFVERLSGTIPYYSLRHTVRPGITGWAQVMFPYCGTVEESKEKLQYDLFYVKNMSVMLDLLIIIRTIKIMILGHGAR